MENRQRDNFSGQTENPAKVTKEAFSRQTSRLHDILDKMVNGYVNCSVVYQDGHAVDLVHEEVNNAYEKLTGLKNVIGCRLTEVMPGIAETNPEFFGKLLQTAQSGIPNQFDIYLDGLGKWFRNSVYCPENGFLVAIIDDITEKKRVEEELQKSERRFKTLFNSESAIQALVVAKNGKILDINQAAADWYGWSIDEMKQMYLKDICAMSCEAIMESLSSVAHGLKKTLVSQHHRADKSIRDVEQFLSRIEIEGQEVIHFIIIDITERKAAEKALVDSEERFKNMFERHSATMLIFDAENGNIIDANHAASDFYGWPREELRHMNIQQINTLSPDALHNEIGSWQPNEGVTRSFSHRRADGSIREVEIFANKLLLNGQSVVYDIIHDIHDRKIAEKTVIESETRFKTLFNSQSGIQVLIDPETGQILDANQTAVEWYGWSLEEMKQMCAGDFNMMTPDLVKSSLASVSSDQCNRFMGLHRRVDGSVRDVEVFRNKIEIDGKPVVHVITHDITERKEAERVLLESESRFRSMFEDHSSPMFVLDPETGKIVDANLSAAEFYGWSIAELKTMHIADINIESKESLPHVMKEWQSINHRSMSFLHRRANGSIRDVEIFGKKFVINGKELIYDIVHDVTERVRLEKVNEFRLQLLNEPKETSVDELLQKTLDKAEQLTESSIGFLFFVADDQQALLLQVVSTNTFQNMCKAEGKGEHYSLQKAGVWADAAREGKSVIHNDYTSLAHRKGMPEGHAVVTREVVVPIIRNKKIMAIMGLGNKATNYDDDDVKLIELLANQIWDIVTNKIAAENGKQMQIQLEHAKKMEMVGQLAAGITHEINNPLNFLTLNNEMLVTNWADVDELIAAYRQTIEHAEPFPELADEVHQIRDKENELDIDMLLEDIPNILQEQKGGLERISAITTSMKGYSHKNVLNSIIEFDLNKVVKDVLAIAKPETSLVAEIDVDLGSIPLVRCNSSQINQVLLNLILNSVHAIKSKNTDTVGKIEVKTWFTDDHVFCSVKDDGPGVPEDIREKIFSPFFTTKAPGAGSGLGLSISYDIIVTKHHGQLTLDCPEEGGAVFTIALPLKN